MSRCFYCLVSIIPNMAYPSFSNLRRHFLPLPESNSFSFCAYEGEGFESVSSLDHQRPDRADRFSSFILRKAATTLNMIAQLLRYLPRLLCVGHGRNHS